jgi:hypothetical protein
VRNQKVHTWKKRFEKFQPDDDRRLKQFKQENAPAEEADGRARPRDRGNKGDRGRKW